jgi:hypothetical protein|tara:strand:- start:417 stop:899 length:483 start_codon:yes stop_codon:yes gene_type:complete
MKIYLSIILCFVSQLINANVVTIVCEAGKWEGNSIDSRAGGKTKFTPNGMTLQKIKYTIPYPPTPDSTVVDMAYDKHKKFKGRVTYFYNSSLYSTVQNDYVIIDAMPELLLERHMILIPSGEVHLTYSKIYGGGTYGGADEITTQSFVNKCRTEGFIANS